MKYIWQFIRDDVWTFFAFIFFCLGILGLLLPAMFEGTPAWYGQAVFYFGVFAFLSRIMKLMALLIFGKFVPADCSDVEHRGWGICLVSYRYSQGDGFRVARRQIYYRDGELKMLCLPKWPGFHLVAWQTPSDTGTCPGDSAGG